MAFSNQLLVRDASTFANYASYSTFMSEFMLTLTWTQTADTGQVQWLGVSSFSSVTNVSGNTWRYAYSGLTTSGTATAFRVGRSVTITGFTGGAAGNNGTFVITSLAGGAGTFDVTNPSGANSIAGAGVITKQTTVPSTGTGTYEIWTPPASALTPFYFKLEYFVNSTQPRFRTTLSTRTDGSGNLIGIVTASYINQPVVVSSTSTTWNCYAAGDTGAVIFAMWRDDYANAAFQTIAVQRGYNNSGAYSSSDTFNHVTIYWADANANSSVPGGQQTLHLTKGPGYGSTPGIGSLSSTAPRGSGSTDNFAGTIGVYPVFPSGIGGVGCNPADILMLAKASDFTEGTIYTIPSANMPYGVSHQYVAIAYRSSPTGFVGTIQRIIDGNTNISTLLIRAD